jgi:hypothetical protein
LQVATSLAGAVTGRGTVVIDGGGYRLLNPLSDEARNLINPGKTSFVKVEAGQSAYVMVSDLPKSLQGIDAPGQHDEISGGVLLSDREVMELILFGTADEIRAALPMMTEDQKVLVRKTMPVEGSKP